MFQNLTFSLFRGLIVYDAGFGRQQLNGNLQLNTNIALNTKLTGNNICELREILTFLQFCRSENKIKCIILKSLFVLL